MEPKRGREGSVFVRKHIGFCGWQGGITNNQNIIRGGSKMKFVSEKVDCCVVRCSLYIPIKLNLGYSDTEILTTAGILVTYIRPILC